MMRLGEGMTKCDVCGKLTYPFLHSCSGVSAAPEPGETHHYLVNGYGVPCNCPRGNDHGPGWIDGASPVQALSSSVPTATKGTR